MTWHVFVCPKHGILSEREADDAPESYVGETLGNPEGTGEPYVCPLPDRGRRKPRQVGDPNWLIQYEDCFEPLREITVEEIA